MRILLVPLDDRPVNVTLPAMVAAVAGARCVAPPAALLGRAREPADPDALTDWVRDTAGAADAVVACLDTLAYGGLIASRTSGHPTADALGRWSVLADLRRERPELPVLAVSTVLRASDSYHGVEEPDYWPRYGRELHALGGALHRRYAGHDGTRLAELRAAVPDEVRRDFLTRRLRNHAANLDAVRLAATGVLSTLLVTSDDTAEWAAGTLEEGWLRHWIDALGAGDRVHVHPGADEVGSVLVARAVLGAAGLAPTVRVHCPVPGADRVAPYENVPVSVTAARQVRAAGGTVVTAGDADVHLVLHPPAPGGPGWHSDFRPDPDPAAVAPVAALAARLVRDGRLVAVADTRYANGADPVLLDALTAAADPYDLAAYAGWNTAGNTIGTAVAHALARYAGRTTGRGDEDAHRRLVAHRLLEDGGYQAGVRGRLERRLGGADVARLDGGTLADAESWLADALGEHLAAAPWGRGLRIAPGTVRLPWRRTFEVDFALGPADGGWPVVPR